MSKLLYIMTLAVGLQSLFTNIQTYSLFADNSKPMEIQIRLSPEIGNDITRAGTHLSEESRRNIDAVFSQLGESMPRMGPGIEAVGRSTARSVGHVQNQVLIGAAILSVIVITAVVVCQAAKKYIKHYLFEPSLVDQKSPRGLSGWVKSWFAKPVALEEHMVISADLKEKLNYIMQMTSTIKANDGQFENVLLYGPPGTGKTLFATLLAQHTGMDYAIVPAANVSQFLANGTAVQELKDLFAWAEKSKHGTIIFFDEIEVFLANRSTLNSAAQNVLSSFLAQTGTPSNNIMIIGATNKPAVIDKAALDRFGMKVEFMLPDVDARQKQLVMHVKKIFAKQKGKKVKYEILKDPEYLQQLAEQLDGLSGRQIQKFVVRLRQMALAQDELVLRPDFVEHIVAQVLENKDLGNYV